MGRWWCWRWLFGSIPSLDAAEERFEDVTTPRLFQGRPTHLACDTRRNRDFHEETERNGEVLWGTLNASSYTKKQQLFIFSVVNYQLLVTCGKSFRFPKGRHPSVCRYGTARTGNLLSMRLPLLLEMAGTCYIITEGGKTHTFQHYLYQETHTENIPTALNSETFQGRLEQRGPEQRVAYSAAQAVTPQRSWRLFDQSPSPGASRSHTHDS